jgi:hypothetical protein
MWSAAVMRYEIPTFCRIYNAREFHSFWVYFDHDLAI